MISDTTLSALGGRQHVRDALRRNRTIAVTDLEHGVAISAGDVPQLGDASLREVPPAYREVARVLRPVCIPDVGGFGGPVIKADFTNEWLNAFDVDKA